MRGDSDVVKCTEKGREKYRNVEMEDVIYCTQKDKETTPEVVRCCACTQRHGGGRSTGEEEQHRKNVENENSMSQPAQIRTTPKKKMETVTYLC